MSPNGVQIGGSTSREGAAGSEQMSVNREYFHGVQVELEEKKRKVEELEAEVERLREELACYKVTTQSQERKKREGKEGVIASSTGQTRQ